MNSVWFRRAILRVLKFLKIKEGGLISWGEPVLQNGWIIWSPLLYFNFKSFNNPISSSFIRLQCILHNSGVIFSDFWNFHKLKRGDQISGENQFYRKFELFDSGEVSSDFWNFYKLKKGELISAVTNSAESLNYLVPPPPPPQPPPPSFCFWILKLWRSQIINCSLDSNAFYMIQKNFCQTFGISTS